MIGLDDFTYEITDIPMMGAWAYELVLTSDPLPSETYQVTVNGNLLEFPVTYQVPNPPDDPVTIVTNTIEVMRARILLALQVNEPHIRWGQCNENCIVGIHKDQQSITTAPLSFLTTETPPQPITIPTNENLATLIRSVITLPNNKQISVFTHHPQALHVYIERSVPSRIRRELLIHAAIQDGEACLIVRKINT